MQFVSPNKHLQPSLFVGVLLALSCLIAGSVHHSKRAGVPKATTVVHRSTFGLVDTGLKQYRSATWEISRTNKWKGND